MSEVVNETLKWWRKFIGKDVLLSTSKTKLFVSINNLTLPHLLGLHYCYKESRYVSANRILKELDLKELDFAKGMRYNPFDYIKSQKDILKLLQVMQRQYDLAKKEKLTEKTSIRAKIKDYQEKNL